MDTINDIQYFVKESQFEQALVDLLPHHGWEKEVIVQPTEEDLIQNWAKILFDNNRDINKLGNYPLTASEFAKAHRYRKVCLLGTLPTMNGTFFQQSFESKGIEVITPDAAEKEYIGRKIETELELGKVVSDTQNNFRTIAERIIQDENVDTIILGCTELPLIFKGIDLSVPCLNVMQVHIDSLIDLIMSE